MRHSNVPNDYEAFDYEYEDWLRALDEENEEELDYALGKQPAQCPECGDWFPAKDLIGGEVCEDCAYGKG